MVYIISDSVKWAACISIFTESILVVLYCFHMYCICGKIGLFPYMPYKATDPLIIFFFFFCAMLFSYVLHILILTRFVKHVHSFLCSFFSLIILTKDVYLNLECNPLQYGMAILHLTSKQELTLFLYDALVLKV